MATLSSIGIGSGLDMKTILPALLQVQQAPVDALAARKTDLQSQLSNFGKVQSYMSTLRDSLRKLTDSASWSAVTAASSDTTAVAISASSGSPASSYSVSVQRLASAQQLASAAFADSSTVVGEGSMTIELGRWNADDGSFTAKDGATAVTLEFGPEDNTLAKIRDKINGANAGVMASIVTDASGARLTLRSKETGETSGFRISVEDQDADNTNAAGLSALAYDPASGANGMARNEAAANALASINGLEISAPSNTLTDVIDGLTLTLGKTTSTAVALTVNRDNESIKKAVTDFASAYNDIIKYLRDQTKYNPADKTAGTLQGDRTAVSLAAATAQPGRWRQQRLQCAHPPGRAGAGPAKRRQPQGVHHQAGRRGGQVRRTAQGPGQRRRGRQRPRRAGAAHAPLRGHRAGHRWRGQRAPGCAAKRHQPERQASRRVATAC